MSLVAYQKKRDFKRTKEPKGRIEKSHKRIFVIQEHHASHLHYDFRLELDGVLKSWAVPKGPPLQPKEKRLAVQVEDHPLSYATFEGEIPKGEYGAGTVKIWDHGEWKTDHPANAQLEKGHLEFELKGERLNGKWMLVRTGMRGGKKVSWLLIKRSGGEPVPTRRTHSSAQAHAAKLPRFFEPQLASLVSTPPRGENWVHEVKFDGYRTGCRIENGKIQMLTRRGLDWTDKYGKLALECKKIPVRSAYLDGEVVCVDSEGKSQFQKLQNALEFNKSDRLLYYVFDLLYLDGKDLRALSLKERKGKLAPLIRKTKSKKILYSEHWDHDGLEVFRASCGLDLEGIVSKESSRPYDSGRSRDWRKTKCKHIQEFIIGGYTLQNNGASLGALLMGAYDVNQKLRYLGRVGTGFGPVSGGNVLLKKLKKLKSAKNPFQVKSPSARQVQFVKPQLVANVEFGAWTPDRVLRHAAFKGLREDKTANEVLLDEQKPESLPKLSHPDKVLFPKSRNTKQDLADYYTAIEKVIMPHLAQRPLALLRCPEGAGKACFFQKHIEGETSGIHKKDGVLYVQSLQGLLSLVQIGTLELHTRGCHMDNMDSPDLIVFDFDPDPGVRWAEIREAAFAMKALLDHMQLTSFVKVTGGKGLHVHVPIEPLYTWDQVKMFSKTLCQKLEMDSPGRYTTNSRKALRKNKIFLDYLRNGLEASAIAPYSVRAKPNATIALPITWKELATLKGPDSFTMEKMTKTLPSQQDPWPEYFLLQQRISLLDSL